MRAAEVLCSFPEVDRSRVAFTGASQGGGLSLAAAALSLRPSFVWADVPFLCDFPRAVQTATEDPYPEIPRLLRLRPELEQVAFATLSYVDVANLAHRVSCPVVVTVALWDEICPPSTIFGPSPGSRAPTRRCGFHPFQGHALRMPPRRSNFPGSSSASGWPSRRGAHMVATDEQVGRRC